jgi:hypothetical protein
MFTEQGRTDPTVILRRPTTAALVSPRARFLSLSALITMRNWLPDPRPMLACAVEPIPAVLPIVVLVKIDFSGLLGRISHIYLKWYLTWQFRLIGFMEIHGICRDCRALRDYVRERAFLVGVGHLLTSLTRFF